MSYVVEVEGGEAYSGPDCASGLNGQLIKFQQGVAAQSFFVRAASPVQLVARLKAMGSLITLVSLQRPVRRRTQAGSCLLGGSVTAVTCALHQTVVRSRTLLVVQPRAVTGTPAQTLVACALTSDGTSVQCQRGLAGTQVTVEWQTLESPALSVEHLLVTLDSTLCLTAGGGAVSQLPLEGLVDASRTAVVFTASSTETTWSTSAFLRSELKDLLTGSSGLLLHGRCNGVVSAQLIQLPVGMVEHSVLDMAAANATVTLPASGMAPQLFLVDWQSPPSTLGGADPALCDFLLAVHPSGTSARVERASDCAAAALQVHIQRVFLPLGVVRGPYALNLEKGTSSVDVSAPQAQPNRDRLVLGGAQALNGQSGAQLKDSEDRLDTAALAASSLLSIQGADVIGVGLTLQVVRSQAATKAGASAQLLELAPPDL